MVTFLGRWLFLSSYVSTSLKSPTMLGSVLPFTPELADRVSEYCEAHSEGSGPLSSLPSLHVFFIANQQAFPIALPPILAQHWDWTVRTWMDAEMMSSKLQGQWLIWMTQWMAPKRSSSAFSIATYIGPSPALAFESCTITDPVAKYLRSARLQASRHLHFMKEHVAPMLKL